MRITLIFILFVYLCAKFYPDQHRRFSVIINIESYYNGKNFNITKGADKNNNMSSLSLACLVTAVISCENLSEDNFISFKSQ